MFEFSDQVFARCSRCCPPTAGRASPGRDHRQVLGGIVWKLHIGRPWRDVPERFGPWQTCYSRLRRRQAYETWPRMWGVLGAGEHGSTDDRRGQPVLAAPVAAARPGLMATPLPRPPSTCRSLGASTVPGRPAAAAPPRSKPGPAPNLANLEVVAVLRAQLPPSPAWARTAGRQERLGDQDQGHMPIQASQQRTW